MSKAEAFLAALPQFAAECRAAAAAVEAGLPPTPISALPPLPFQPTAPERKVTLEGAYADLLGRAIAASRAGDQERFNELAAVTQVLEREYPALKTAFQD